jgi:hypothetical protein
MFSCSHIAFNHVLPRNHEVETPYLHSFDSDQFLSKLYNITNLHRLLNILKLMEIHKDPPTPIQKMAWDTLQLASIHLPNKIYFQLLALKSFQHH